MEIKNIKNRNFFILFIIVMSLVIYASKDLLVLFSTPTISENKSWEIYEDLGGDLNHKVPVVLFMTSWCPACQAAKSFMEREKIPFVIADIESSNKAANHYLFLTEGANIGIPQIVIGDKVVSGYRPATISKSFTDQLNE